MRVKLPKCGVDLGIMSHNSEFRNTLPPVSHWHIRYWLETQISHEMPDAICEKANDLLPLGVRRMEKGKMTSGPASVDGLVMPVCDWSTRAIEESSTPSRVSDLSSVNLL